MTLTRVGESAIEGAIFRQVAGIFISNWLVIIWYFDFRNTQM